MKLTLTFHEDPGHGWLEVPKALLAGLDVADKISGYSYQHNGNAYLEEDRDYSVFMRAAEAAGWEVTTNEVYEENTPIRNYPSYAADPCPDDSNYECYKCGDPTGRGYDNGVCADCGADD